MTISQKRKKEMNLAAKALTWGPAPEVDNAASNYESSYWAASGFNATCSFRLDRARAWSFHYFKLHKHTSFSIGIYRAPHLGALLPSI